MDFDPPSRRLCYSREEPLRFRTNDVILSRPTRKAVFSFGLWLPRNERISRQPSDRCKQPTDQLIGKADIDHPSSNLSVKLGLLNARSIGQKAANVASVICEDSYDVFLITETWHTSREDAALSRCVPDGFVCIDQPRPVSADNSTTTKSRRRRCYYLRPVPLQASAPASHCNIIRIRLLLADRV